jgi:8-oxo-dGTP diphosphatase
VRPGEGGESSVLLVHRPSYDDWTLPKGKNEPDETDEACAVREVEEETGLRCVLGPRVAEVEYRDHKDRSKTVVYFLMTPIDGAFLPNDEVDEVRWLGLEPATQLLSYSRDADIVRRALGETTTTRL